MPEDHMPCSFDDVIARLRDGDEQVALEVFDRFAQRLIRLASSLLSSRIAQKVGPEDVAQSVLRSFVRRHHKAAFTVASWDNLWGLLTQIAVNKCRELARFYRRKCRDASREVPMDAGDDSLPPIDVPGPEPTPDEAVDLAETVQRLMQALPDPIRDPQIVELLLQGYQEEEIAERVKCSKRTVARTKQRVRELLEKWCNQDLENPPGGQSP